MSPRGARRRPACDPSRSVGTAIRASAGGPIRRTQRPLPARGPRPAPGRAARPRQPREDPAPHPPPMAAAPALVAERERLGELLVREGLVTREQLTRGLQEQAASGMRLGYCLVKL